MQLRARPKAVGKTTVAESRWGSTSFDLVPSRLVHLAHPCRPLRKTRKRCTMYIVELRTPAMPEGVGGGKEGGGCYLNMRTWHAEGRRPSLGLCWPSLGLCWPILRPWWPMPMRTKCCNLQHSALWDGKNPCKYQSCSPRKWLKHSYLQSFVHITIFVFWKTCKYQRFLHSLRQNIGSKSAKNCVNTSVSASKSGQNTAIYSVSCLPRFLEIAKTLWIPAFSAINTPKML